MIGGLDEAAMVSAVVCSLAWLKSTATPRLFILLTASCPSGVKPPPFGSITPAAKGDLRLYDNCITRTPRLRKSSIRSSFPSNIFHTLERENDTHLPFALGALPI